MTHPHRQEVITLARWVAVSGNPSQGQADRACGGLAGLTADQGALHALTALDGLSAEERRDVIAAAEALGRFYADCRRRAARRLLARIGGAA